MTADRKSAPTTPMPTPVPTTPGSDGSRLKKPRWPSPVAEPPPPPPKKPSVLRRVRNCLGHLGIMLVLAGYTAAGGVGFRLLEHPNEMEVDASVRDQVNATKLRVLDRLVNLVLNESARGAGDNVTDLVQAQMDELQQVVLIAADEGVDFLNEGDPEWMWTFGSSFFFAATVVTTIGYGNIAPVTPWGRFFCIVFALFGIPLTLIAIADMGKLFATSLKIISKKMRKLCPKKKKSLDLTAANGGGGGKSGSTTLGDDDGGGGGSSGSSTALKVLGAILLLLLYISIGAVLFMIWEEWTFFDSFYFCFITMTTIGLGDLVPDHQMFMLLCTVYILVGLAVTSTCIELARSEYEKSWQRMVEASRRLQNMSGISLADTLRRLNEQIETHGEIVDFSVLKDLKNAIKATQGLDDDCSTSTTVPDTPPLYVIYETSV